MKVALEPVLVGGADYEYVPPGATAQVLGTAGAMSDHLARLVVNVTTPATSSVSIQDGTDAAIVLVPATTPVGAYSIELGLKARIGPWKVTTGAGVSLIAVGQFSL